MSWTGGKGSGADPLLIRSASGGKERLREKGQIRYRFSVSGIPRTILLARSPKPREINCRTARRLRLTAPTPLDTLTESHNFFVARDLPDVTPRFKTTFLFPLGYIRYLMSRVYVCILLKRLV